MDGYKEFGEAITYGEACFLAALYFEQQGMHTRAAEELAYAESVEQLLDQWTDTGEE
jgi:hypothetical protein